VESNVFVMSPEIRYIIIPFSFEYKPNSCLLYSNYELKRKLNIEQNQDLLRELGLNDGSTGIAAVKCVSPR
jgi:hypothetical protein